MEPTLAVTLGDPCGIGPEVLLKSLSGPGASRLVVIGDLAVVTATARRHRLRVPRWSVLDQPEALRRLSASTGRGRRLIFVDLPSSTRFLPGHSRVASGAAALAYLDCAIALWRAGRLHGLVTGPVTKWAMQRRAPAFIGQTEYLADAMKVRRVVMMFMSARLNVALLTRHIPLRQVGAKVSGPLLEDSVRLVDHLFRRRLGRRRPRLALCGLNPHAGERGLCGTEEQRLLAPVRRLRRSGISIDGPLAADGLFPAAGRYDAVICWYHDQGLIPFKLLARDIGCQLSVGLPIVRTSPDHGSALDIAGRGVADPGSMRYALRLAASLMHHEK